MSLGQVTRVLGHEKALGPCRESIKRLAIPFVGVPNSDRAAAEIAAAPTSTAAALGPVELAGLHGLHVLNSAFEDVEAFTTFVLVESGDRVGAPGVSADAIDQSLLFRSLLVFRVKHVTGALVDVLAPFKKYGINLTYIHPLYTSNGSYDFAVETECWKDQIDAHQKAVGEAVANTAEHRFFGPFPLCAI